MFLWGIETSLKSEDDFLMSKNILGFPSLNKDDPFNSRGTFFNLSNYAEVVKGFEFPVTSAYWYQGKNIMRYKTVNIPIMLVNTIIYAGGLALIRAFIPALVGYVCAKFDFKFNKVLITYALVTMTLPVIGTEPSILALQQKIGLYDTFFGHFLQNLGYGGMYFFIYISFFKGMSNSYNEAAEIDGASQFTILFKIVLPLTMNIVGTVMLLQFVHFWNSYQAPIMYLPTNPTLAYGLYYLVYNQGDRSLATTPHMLAGCMMLMLPTLVLFIIFRDKLVGNLSLGGSKE